MDLGQLDGNGRPDSENAKISWSEVVKRGWDTGRVPVPLFWRDAVRKALIEHNDQLHREEMNRRFGRREQALSEASPELQDHWHGVYRGMVRNPPQTIDDGQQNSPH